MKSTVLYPGGEMDSTTCGGVAGFDVEGGRSGGGAEQADRRRSGNPGSGAGAAEETRPGLGVKEWDDGSRYEGEIVNGLRHGKGRSSWRNGEYYEGSYYKDYRHGNASYCWPSGHKFIGKFYLNRREGYGQHVFPDGAIFQGLYHTDQRFGPGVISYPDKRQDVGLWLGKRLLKLCSSVEDCFSLKSFPEYATYMDSNVTADSLTQKQLSSSDIQTNARTLSKVNIDSDLLSDDNFILPRGIESYSTDGDHLPLPPGRRKELDQLFHGELWESDSTPHKGYERHPLSSLPLQARMQAHINNHRLHAQNVGWDVAAVLSLNRESFGPKGPFEVRSELMIRYASQGDLHALSQILQTGDVHPDVADASGHTALIAATINCHNDVIHLLLDLGSDIDKLNHQGMSALAVCYVLYYPFHCLNTTLTEPSSKALHQESSSLCGNSRQINQDSAVNSRPPTTDIALADRSSQSHLSPRASSESVEQILHPRGEVIDDCEHVSELYLGLNELQTPACAAHLQDDEGEASKGVCTYHEETGRDQGEKPRREDDRESKEDGNQIDQNDDTGEKEEIEGKFIEGEVETKENNEIYELRENTATESRKEHIEKGEEVEEDVENIEESGNEEAPAVERSIQVLDGHIVLGHVPWREAQAEDKDEDPTTEQVFDSAASVSSFNIQVTEEAMQCSAEALSCAGVRRDCDTEGTVGKMAAMKIERRVRLNTLKLLLERGADPNVSRVPMPVLFLAIMAADIEAVRRLLLCGVRTDIALPTKKKGLYPLHVAAALPGPAGPRITELLLHAITDPDSLSCDQDELYEHERIAMKATMLLSNGEAPHLKEGGRTALHVACQRDNDYQNASEVVGLLVSHRASTDLLWSGHSPLSLAIASGNYLAVEVLLNGGADPNIPLGPRVGSALCALCNINYHSGGNQIKLLKMLANAGADFLMPIKVGDVVGTVIDYAHHSFKQDERIANTPFHALNVSEMETYKARQQLLTMMAKFVKEAAAQKEKENLERERLLELNNSNTADEIEYAVDQGRPPKKAETQRKPLFKFCYYCGRSVSVMLNECNTCHKVQYCSNACKRKAWDENHREECAKGTGSTKGAELRPLRGTRPLTVMLTSKTATRPLSDTPKSQRVTKPVGTDEKVWETQINLKENYSFN